MHAGRRPLALAGAVGGSGGGTGVDLRQISADNIESVEVISGVPSAEYGDLGSGMVKVTTRKGRTPVQATFSVNPRTYDVSVSKGIGIGEGVLNISGQWTRATQKLTSPYTSYTRRGFTAEYSRTFARKLRLEAGVTGNLGGMDSKDDPDAFSEEYTKAHDNLLTPHLKLTWMLSKSWVTNLSLEGSVYYHDNQTHEHLYNSYGSSQPAVHAEELGYFLATALPPTFSRYLNTPNGTPYGYQLDMWDSMLPWLCGLPALTAFPVSESLTRIRI